MFTIGEAETTVYNSKVRVPKEYNLRKRKHIYSVWTDEYTMYIADEIVPLKAKAGRDAMIEEIHIDLDSCISVSDRLDKKHVTMKGCITTIEIKFKAEV